MAEMQSTISESDRRTEKLTEKLTEINTTLKEIADTQKKLIEELKKSKNQ